MLLESIINSEVMAPLLSASSSPNAAQTIQCLSYSYWFWSTERHWNLWCWNLI